jgi:5'-3' exonuclease
MKGIFELEEDFEEKNADNLVLIDCLNLSFRYKHKGQTDFSADFVRTVRSFGKSYGARKIVLLADKKSSSYRKDIFPEYKGNRKEKYKDQTEEEKQKALEFFEGYERALELAADNGLDILRFDRVEADDLAAYLVKSCKDKFTHTWLISSDADWDLLLSDKVSRFSFVTRKEYTVDNFFEEHGCDNPEQYVSVKVLQGDSGDGVPGIPLIGPTRAYQLLRDFGTAMDIYDAMPLPEKLKTFKNINQSGNLIPLNYQLMDLVTYCAEAIGESNCQVIDETLELYLK